MSLPVFAAVLLAALLHALWNGMVKGGTDKRLSMAGVVLGHLPPALVVLALVPLPAVASLPWLLSGIALHFGYQMFLIQAYRVADLSQAYPIARGSAPLLVALISVLFLGVTLNALEWAAILTIAIGILSISLTRQADGLRNLRGAHLALATGGFIAAYSLVDGTGARISGSPLGYYAWIALGNAALMIAYLRLRAPGLLRTLPRKVPLTLLIGGPISFAAYALVIWAFTQAPIPLVTALRESSIIFALLIGVFFLKERLDLTKVTATALTLAGMAMLRFAKA